MKSIKYQQGLGTLGWLVVLVTAGAVLTCAFRILPHYFDNISIRDALHSLAAQNENVDAMEREEIVKFLNNYMLINNVRGKESESFKIVRRKGRTLVNNVYEERIHLIANIDVLLTFKSQLDSDNPEACCEYLVEDTE